jgi:type IV pilus assembly protein PilM
MDIQKIVKKINFDKLKLSKKVDQVIVVDIGEKLTLLDVELKGETKITALKIVDLGPEKTAETIASSLKGFIQENQIQHNNAVLKIHLESLLIKRIQLPAVPEAELPEAIKWQIKEDVPFDLTQSVLDYSIISKKTKDDGSKVLDIICILAKQEEVKNKALVLKQAGLKCLSVSVLASAYARLIEKYLRDEDSGPWGILHLERDSCYLAIYKQGKLQFYRELPTSIDKLKQALSGVLVSDRGKVELSSDEAEEVLFGVGIAQAGSVYEDKVSSAQILAMIRPILERLAQELKRSLTYYVSEFEGEKINKIFISGLGPGVPGLDKFLSQESGLVIRNFPGQDKISISSKVDSGDLSRSYWNLAPALDYEKGINLLPHEFRAEKSEKVQKVSLRWIAFIAFLLLGVSYFFSQAQITAQEKRLDNALLHLNVISEIQQTKVNIDQLAGFFNQTKSSGLPADKLLKRLSSFAPRELFINSLSLDSASSSGSFSGFVKTSNKNPEVILTRFIGLIGSSQYFTDLSLSSLKKKKEANLDIAEYNITFSIP